jgi:hypothetical protein
VNSQELTELDANWGLHCPDEIQSLQSAQTSGFQGASHCLVLPQCQRQGDCQVVNLDLAIDATAEAYPGSGSEPVTKNDSSITTDVPHYESPSIHTNSHIFTSLADSEEEAQYD